MPPPPQGVRGFRPGSARLPPLAMSWAGRVPSGAWRSSSHTALLAQHLAVLTLVLPLETLLRPRLGRGSRRPGSRQL
ncbi:hypothetical protein Q9966_014354 [Columba livia]|nr:hypothetical protein Q9966_014354 [Columba livia]